MVRQYNQKTKKGSAKKMEKIPQDTAKEFYRKVLVLQEEEKKRISRDIHDETGQIAIALGALLNVMEKELKEGDVEKVLQMINESRKIVKDISSRLKSMSLNLRPPALGILGLPAVLREYFSQCTKLNPIKIEFNENMEDRKLDESIEIALYRIIQEAMYNTQKHSEATLVRVDLILAEKELRLFIEDNGRGFDLEEYESKQDVAKIGLQGIRERVDLLKGTFVIESKTGSGVKLKITLPLTRV